MSEQQGGQNLAEALRIGFIEGISQRQIPVMSIGQQPNDGPWYQPAIDHTFIAIVVATVAMMGIAHVVTLFICRRGSVSSGFPLSMLWGSFLVSLALGILGTFPPVGIALAIGVIVFLMMRRWRT